LEGELGREVARLTNSEDFFEVLHGGECTEDGRGGCTK
jgi:hypothetical protein